MSLELAGHLLFVLIKLTCRYSNLKPPETDYDYLIYRHATTTEQSGKLPGSTCEYPTPDSMILERYLKWISVRRDEAGDPPIILEYDGNE